MAVAGDTQIGPYRILRQLATGGMAEVLLAQQHGPRGFERGVVLKRMLPHLARDEAFVNMFLDEARTVGRLNHPNVVQVFDLVRDDGVLFLVMEHLVGEPLSALVARMTQAGESLAPAIAAYIVAEACAGLHAAHEIRNAAGEPFSVVHRDVSPQNLFVTRDGTVKVIDFGVAKARDQIVQTQVGDLRGKPGYVSPEQARGDVVDRRSDIFSLGIVLYEALTMRRLFLRGTALASLRAVDEPVIPPRRLVDTCPPSLERICMRALEYEPGDRYPTALAMRQELLAAIDELGGPSPHDELAAAIRSFHDTSSPALPEAVDEAALSTARVRPSRLRRLAIAGAVVVGLGTGLLVVSELSTSNPSPSAGVERAAAKDDVPGARIPPDATDLAVGRPAVAAESRAEVVSRTEATAVPSTKPTHVTFVIESEPSGASVLLDGVSIGRTPLRTERPMRRDPQTVVVKKRGYEAARSTIALDRDRDVYLHLRPVRAPSSPAKRKRTGADVPAQPTTTADPLRTKF